MKNQSHHVFLIYTSIILTLFQFKLKSTEQISADYKRYSRISQDSWGNHWKLKDLFFWLREVHSFNQCTHSQQDSTHIFTLGLSSFCAHKQWLLLQAQLHIIKARPQTLHRKYFLSNSFTNCYVDTENKLHSSGNNNKWYESYRSTNWTSRA